MQARSAQQIWEAALGELQIQVNKPNYRTWLAKTVGLSYQDEQFVIGVPNTFVAEYLEKNQRSLIEKILAGLTQHEFYVQFQVNTTQSGLPFKPIRQPKPNSARPSELPLFNPKYTFDSFVNGSGNQLAYAAAKRVAQNPGQSYNPLFIYGGPGLGKTHLLHAIGHVAQANNKKVLYATAEQYTNQLMNAFRERNTEEFHNKYRCVDVLLIDDVQFFNGKEQTGENFFHTFNELHSASHQVTMTSDCPPKSLTLLPERLRSRFEWGLVTDIQAPDFDTRLAILQTKTKQGGLDIPPEVLEVIALQIKQSIRALEGALNRVVACANLIRTTLTPELAAQALKDIGSNENRIAPITPCLIMEAVVNSFQVLPSDLKSQKRDEATVLARQVAMYLIRQETNYSLAAIGKELGGRSPATVSHGYQKIAGNLNNDPSLRRKVFEIQQRLYALAENPNYQVL